jgi:serine/threonine-protein kinase RsbW
MTHARAFPGRSEAVSAARRFVRQCLAEEPGATVDEVELMVSELATNCVQHAKSSFEVAIEVAPRLIRVEARDGGAGAPTPRSPTASEPTGRGLRIVEAMSDSWGIIPCREGKTVWFTVPRAPATAAEDARSVARGEVAGDGAEEARATPAPLAQADRAATRRGPRGPRAAARARARPPALERARRGCPGRPMPGAARWTRAL